MASVHHDRAERRYNMRSRLHWLVIAAISASACAEPFTFQGNSPLAPHYPGLRSPPGPSNDSKLTCCIPTGSGVTSPDLGPKWTRTVFGKPFHADTVNALEAHLGPPVEASLAPLLYGFEPDPKYLERVRKVSEGRLPAAKLRVDEALIAPMASLLGELRELRTAYDTARAEGDESTMHTKRAALAHVYSEGMSKIRRVAASAMAMVLLEGYDLEYVEPDLVDRSVKLAQAAGVHMSWQVVENILRAGGPESAARRVVELVASSTLDALVARHRPSCAIYVTFK